MPPSLPKYFYFNAFLFSLLVAFMGPPLKGAPEIVSNTLITVEVTVRHYCDFLNSTAATDLHHCYDEKMASQQGAILRSGLPGNYSYLVNSEGEKNLVYFVSEENQIRFCNWLEKEKCSLFNEDLFQNDCLLKANSASFSIIGPADLLGATNGRPYDQNTYACSGAEVIMTLGQEIEECLLFGAGLLGAGEGARRVTGENAGGETTHRTATLEERRERGSSQLSHSINNSYHCEKNRNLTLSQRVEQAEAEHQKAEQAHRNALEELEDAHHLLSYLQLDVEKRAADISERKDEYDMHFNPYNDLLQKASLALLDYQNHHFKFYQAISWNCDAAWIQRLENDAKQKFFEWHQIHLSLIQEEGYLRQLAANLHALEVDQNDPTRAWNLDKAYQGHELAQMYVKETGETLADCAKELAEFRKALTLKMSIETIEDVIRKKLELLKNRLPVQEAQLPKDEVDSLKERTIDDEQSSLFSQDTTRSDLTSLENGEQLQRRTATILDSVRNQIEPLKGIIPPEEICLLFDECEKIVSNLSRDHTTTSLEDIILNIIDEKIALKRASYAMNQETCKEHAGSNNSKPATLERSLPDSRDFIHSLTGGEPSLHLSDTFSPPRIDNAFTEQKAPGNAQPVAQAPLIQKKKKRSSLDKKRVEPASKNQQEEGSEAIPSANKNLDEFRRNSAALNASLERSFVAAIKKRPKQQLLNVEDHSGQEFLGQEALTSPAFLEPVLSGLERGYSWIGKMSADIFTRIRDTENYKYMEDLIRHRNIIFNPVLSINEASDRLLRIMSEEKRAEEAQEQIRIAIEKVKKEEQQRETEIKQGDAIVEALIKKEAKQKKPYSKRK